MVEGGYVVLIGNKVSNGGSISVLFGLVVMVVGSDVILIFV